MSRTHDTQIAQTPPHAAHVYIQWLDDPGDPADLGGKAAPLARAIAAGLPVPPGFAITPHAFPAREQPPTDTGDAGDIGTGSAFAPGAAEEIRRAYRALGARLGEPAPRVAVRSSASAEDLAGASFAGQYDTFLHVRGEAELLAFAARCWASLWSESAASYRRHYEARTATTLPPPRMAVLVQQLVDADAAGVAFTAHPTTGDRTHVLINAGWGLGQSIVDGEVEADTWLVDRETLVVAEQTVGFKATKRAVGTTAGTTTGAAPGDAAAVPVPEHLQRTPCLTATQAAAVAALALRAETLTGGPADVEWAVAAEAVYLLQARPITTLPPTASTPTASIPTASVAAPAPAATPTGAPADAPPSVIGPTADFPFDWPTTAAREVNWQLRSIDQRRPEVLPPLEQDVRLIWYGTFERAAVICGRPRYRIPLYVNGYEYVGEIANPRPETDLALRRDALEQVGAGLTERGETYRHVVQFPTIDEGNTRLAGVDVPALSPSDLAAHLEAAIDWFEQLWTAHWTAPQDNPAGRFTKFFRQHVATPAVSDDAVDDAVRQLSGFEPNLLTAAVDGLIELARTVQGAAPLRRLFLDCTADEVLDALPRTPGGAAWRAQLDTLLETQGLRSGAGFGTERSQILPGWAERPALVIELVQKYVPQDLDVLARARLAAVAERDQRAAALRATLPDDARRIEFDFWLDAARKQQAGFEDHNYKIDSAASALLHRAISGAARRLADAGVLPTPDDVWWLRLRELCLALRGVAPPLAPAAGEDDGAGRREGENKREAEDDGDGDGQVRTAEPPHWHALIAARRAHHAWCARLTPPPALGSTAAPPPPAPGSGPLGRPPRQPAAASDAAGAAAPPNLLVKGSPGSQGIATGRVRLVSHADLVPSVAEGDVLVARNAGPLWTPVFPAVAAVVLDQGVLFQHAMLTCREYGVPAVFQTKDATERLTEGQRVTVDGTHGWILSAD